MKRKLLAIVCCMWFVCVVEVLACDLPGRIPAEPSRAVQCEGDQCPTPNTKQLTQPRVERSAPQAFFVRVRCPEARGSSYGSGTLVHVDGKSGYVLTAWHIMRDLRGTPEVIFPNGKVYRAEVIKSDETVDLMVLRIADPGVRPILLAAEPPAPGEVVFASGYGSGTYQISHGRFVQYVSPDAQPRPGMAFDFMEHTAMVRPGDSGGPIFNTRGLFGVTCGGRAGESMGVCLPRLRAVLRCLLPPYPNRPGVIVPRPTPHPQPWRPSPKPEPLGPVVPVIPPSPSTDALESLQAELVDVRAELAALKALCRQPGPAGLPGNDGQDGSDGQDGKDGQVGLPGIDGKDGQQGAPGNDAPAPDLDALAEQIKQRIEGSIIVSVEPIP